MVHRTCVLPLVIVAAGFALCGCAATPVGADAVNRVDGDTLLLSPIAKLGPGAGKEISGIVASRREAGVFWTENDSGDEPRVYPVWISRDGSPRAGSGERVGQVVKSVRYPRTPGVLLGGVLNNDWEDIALDASGRLIVADFGNNTNARKDLALHFIEEPEPDEGRAVVTRTVLFRYPEQARWPAPKGDFNYDAEALFTVGDEVYVLSKHRSDTMSRLYRLDAREVGVVNVLTRVGEFDALGQVTGADASEDGLMLAVLTYERIFVFERGSVGESFFAGKVRSRRYRYADGASDSEAICFEGRGEGVRTLLIADEARGVVSRVGLEELAEGVE